MGETNYMKPMFLTENGVQQVRIAKNNVTLMTDAALVRCDMYIVDDNTNCMLFHGYSRVVYRDEVNNWVEMMQEAQDTLTTITNVLRVRKAFLEGRLSKPPMHLLPWESSVEVFHCPKGDLYIYASNGLPLS